MSELTRSQVEVLSLHQGTSRDHPRRNPMNGKYYRKFEFPTHPTAMALRKRGLLDYRGYDGRSAGGWFITTTGEEILAAQSVSEQHIRTVLETADVVGAVDAVEKVT